MSLRFRAVSAVGQRIKRLREERGLSQRDLAEPGVSYAYVSRIEDGQRTPSAKALRKLAEKLGTTALPLLAPAEAFASFTEIVEWLANETQNSGIA